MRESELSRKVVTLFRKHKIFCQRIESGKTGRGIPDLYWMTFDNRFGWLEFKVNHTVRNPKNIKAKDVGWRPGQQEWMCRANIYNANVCSTLIAWDGLTCGTRYMVIPMDHLRKPDESIKETLYADLQDTLFVT